jgi:hypothetical protein
MASLPSLLIKFFDKHHPVSKRITRWPARPGSRLRKLGVYLVPNDLPFKPAVNDL